MAKLLIIDDCETTLELLSSRLSIDGHDVMPTVSGRQALELLRCAAFDLIITDVYMPEFDGLELLCELQARGPDVPIIAMSANGLSIDMFPIARSFGAFATVRKPIDFEILNATIARALDPSPPAPTAEGTEERL